MNGVREYTHDVKDNLETIIGIMKSYHWDMMCVVRGKGGKYELHGANAGMHPWTETIMEDCPIIPDDEWEE